MSHKVQIKLIFDSLHVHFFILQVQIQSAVEPQFPLIFRVSLEFLLISSVQKTGSILKIGFALSKSPNIHRTYLVTVCNQKLIAVNYTGSQLLI